VIQKSLQLFFVVRDLAVKLKHKPLLHCALFSKFLFQLLDLALERLCVSKQRLRSVLRLLLQHLQATHDEVHFLDYIVRGAVALTQTLL